MEIKCLIVFVCLFGFMFNFGYGFPTESDTKQNITINNIIGSWNAKCAYLGRKEFDNYGIGCMEFTFSKYIPSSMEQDLEVEQLNANATFYGPYFVLTSVAIFTRNDSRNAFWNDRLGKQLITFPKKSFSDLTVW